MAEDSFDWVSHSGGILTRDNHVFIAHMKNPNTVDEFLTECYYLIEKKGYDEIIIDLADCQAVFPNVCVPIAAAIQQRRDSGVSIIMENVEGFAVSTHFCSPLVVSDLGRLDPLAKLWCLMTARM